MDLLNNIEDNIISNILATTCYQDCIFTQLDDKHFLTPSAKVVYKMAKQLYLSGELVDNVMVAEYLQADNKLYKSINEYITNCCLDYVTGSTYQYYIDKIKKNYINHLVSEAKDNEDFLAIQQEIESNQSTTTIEHISSGSDNFIDNYFNQAESTINFHIQALKDSIGNLAAGDYFFLSALTGGGKSVFALNIAYDVSLQGKKVLYINLEMTTQQIQNRLVGKIANLDTSKFRRIGFNETEILLYQNTLEKLKDYPIYVASPLNCTPTEIKSLIVKNKPDLVIVDYLGLMSTEVKCSGDTERIGYLSRKIKNMALHFKIPFIVLHQLNRDYKARNDKRPMISDIKNSSQIEQDADFVNFLHRPSLFDEQEDDRLLEFINAKNRHGEPNTIKNLKFIQEYQTIEDY